MLRVHRAITSGLTCLATTRACYTMVLAGAQRATSVQVPDLAKSLGRGLLNQTGFASLLPGHPLERTFLRALEIRIR